ncbi:MULTISPECIES: hypothetical protein [Moorena]|uniref:hypothetical protein n=1 Tax=Moorena TaxID=1155738 RepID=UPI0013017A11|nr:MULTISPECIES: hypothetical protein [Moorena]NEO14747.1 hypothetical protein [Moorena sp. SIO3E8]NEQ00554.1 hypothetical protein [Moorena sp. SIO3F7]
MATLREQPANLGLWPRYANNLQPSTKQPSTKQPSTKQPSTFNLLTCQPSYFIIHISYFRLYSEDFI